MEAPSKLQSGSLIDIKENPGVGVTGLPKEAKVERNRRLAYLYVQSSYEWPQHRKMYNWAYHGCFTSETRIRFGSLDPLGRPHAFQMPAGTDTSSEARGYRRIYPDFGAQPETLTVHPFEEGFYYNVTFTGHHKDTGNAQSLWETGLVLIDEAGRITLWDFWNDNVGLAAFAKDLYGIEPEDLSRETYMAGVMREEKDRGQSAA